MSPEQASGDLDRVGPASDVYSLGATLLLPAGGARAVPDRRGRRRVAAGAAAASSPRRDGCADRSIRAGGDLPEGHVASTRRTATPRRSPWPRRSRPGWRMSATAASRSRRSATSSGRWPACASSAPEPLRPGDARRGDALAGPCPGEHPARFPGPRPRRPRRAWAAGMPAAKLIERTLYAPRRRPRRGVQPRRATPGDVLRRSDGAALGHRHGRRSRRPMGHERGRPRDRLQPGRADWSRRRATTGRVMRRTGTAASDAAHRRRFSPDGPIAQRAVPCPTGAGVVSVPTCVCRFARRRRLARRARPGCSWETATGTLLERDAPARGGRRRPGVQPRRPEAPRRLSRRPGPALGYRRRNASWRSSLIGTEVGCVAFSPDGPVGRDGVLTTGPPGSGMPDEPTDRRADVAPRASRLPGVQSRRHDRRDGQPGRDRPALGCRHRPADRPAAGAPRRRACPGIQSRRPPAGDGLLRRPGAMLASPRSRRRRSPSGSPAGSASRPNSNSTRATRSAASINWPSGSFAAASRNWAAPPSSKAFADREGRSYDRHRSSDRCAKGLSRSTWDIGIRRRAHGVVHEFNRYRPEFPGPCERPQHGLR